MWMHIWVWRHTFESDADWCRSIKNSVHVFAFCFIFFLSSSKWQMYWAGPYEPVVFTFEVSPSPSLSSWVHGWLWTPGNDFKTDCSQSRASARIQSESRGSHAFSLSLSFFFLTVRFFFCGVWHVCAFRWCACGSALCEGGMRMTTLADIQPDLSVTLLEYSPPVWASSYCQWPPVSCNTKNSGCN